MGTSLEVDCAIDSTCLIAFARVGRIPLLIGHFGARARAAKAVLAELQAGEQGRPGLDVICPEEWIAWHDLESFEELQEYAETLRFVGQSGKGEAATIALAKSRGWTAVLDDGAARRRAAALGIAVVGTVGIAADMVTVSQISLDEAWDILEDMRNEEFRLKLTREQFEREVEGRIQV